MTDTPTKLQGTGFIGIPLKQQASMSFSWVSQLNYDNEENSQLLSVNHTKSLFSDVTLTVSGITNVGGARTQGIFATLTYFGNQHDTVNVNSNRQNSKTQAGFQYNHSSGEVNGLNYYVSGLSGEDSNVQGGPNYINRYGSYMLQGAYQDSQTSYTAGMSGSLSWMAGQLNASQKITSSFGVVQVPGYEGVDIYLDNQIITQTNRAGYAFLPYLKAFDDNKISLQAVGMPLYADINETEKHVSPYRSSGALVRFNVKPSHDALVTLRDAHKNLLPPGSQVMVSGSPNRYWVAQDGLAYIAGLQKGNNTVIYSIAT